MDSPILLKRLPLPHGLKIDFKPAKPGDAGIDLYNASPKPIVVPLGRAIAIPSGICVKVPEGWVGMIKARSSTFMKKGLFVVDGVIDAGYTGPLYTVVWNPGLVSPHWEDGLSATGPVVVEPGERVSQLVVVPHHSNLVIEVEDMPVTERGSSGFGSTGA